MKRSTLIGTALAAAVAAIFAVGITGASGAIGPPPPPPSYTLLYVSIGNGSAAEGDYGVMQITARGSVPAATQSHIYWYTTNGTATEGLDYAAQSGTATLDWNGLVTNCSLNSAHDNIYEPNRAFTVHIWSDDPWVVITKPTAMFTILDDDPIPTVSIGDAGTVTEGSALTFPITLSNPSYLPVSVNIARGAGTSANFDDNDITGHSTASPTIPAYSTVNTSFVIQTTDDNVYEGPETVVAHLNSATNATIGAADGTGVVNDNDPMPVVHIANAGTVHHGHAMTFALTLSGQSQLPVTVNFERIVVGFGSYGTGTVSFAPLVTTGSYRYTVPSLGIAAVTVHLTGATNAAFPGGLSNWAYGFGIW
jgi:hypothetical protein